MAFADLEDLELRLDIELSEKEKQMALAALEDASDYARHYGGQNWRDESPPVIVRAIVLNVVSRYMRNPDAFVQSRAGDETLVWSDLRGEAALRFTDGEKQILGEYSFGKQNVGSVGVYAHRKEPLPADCWIPVAGMPSPTYFPLFAAEEAWLWDQP